MESYSNFKISNFLKLFLNTTIFHLLSLIMYLIFGWKFIYLLENLFIFVEIAVILVESPFIFLAENLFCHDSCIRTSTKLFQIFLTVLSKFIGVTILEYKVDFCLSEVRISYEWKIIFGFKFSFFDFIWTTYLTLKSVTFIKSICWVMLTTF